MKKEAQLFITCIVDTLYPQVGEAVVRTLRRAGVHVGFPSGQTCCGQPAFNAGMRPQAKQMARHTIQTLESTGGWVVLPSGSCTAMIRHGYLELFADDPEWLPRAQALSERTYEFTEFLVDVLGIRNVKARFSARVTYHASCHLLRDLGVAVQPRQLLAAVEDLDFVELPHYEECCGFGGVFALEHARVSGAMLARKIAHIDATGAELVVSCDAGCITNMNGGLHRQGKSSRAIHIAQILDHA